MMAVDRDGQIAACCLLVAICAGCAAGAGPAPPLQDLPAPYRFQPHTRLVLILQDGLDAERVLDPSGRGPLSPFLSRAAVALLNPVVPRPLTVRSEYATLGA